LEKGAFGPPDPLCQLKKSKAVTNGGAMGRSLKPEPVRIVKRERRTQTDIKERERNETEETTLRNSEAKETRGEEVRPDQRTKKSIR